MNATLHLQRVGGDEQPLDELVRVLVDERAVLEAARLGLVGVDAEVAREDVLGQEAPLHPGGEAGPSPPPQPARLDLLDQRLRGELAERLAQSLVAAEALVDGERLQSLGAEVLGEQLVFGHDRAILQIVRVGTRSPSGPAAAAARVGGRLGPRPRHLGVLDRGGAAACSGGRQPARRRTAAPRRSPPAASRRWAGAARSPARRADSPPACALGRERSRSRMPSTRSGVRSSWKWWSTCIAGAPPQAPRHSTVLSQVNLPSAVVPPDGQPRRRSTWATISSAPRSAQLDVEADDDVVVAGGLVEVHGVEGAHRLHLARRQAQHLGDLGHPLGGQVAELVLHRPQAGQDRAARVRVPVAQRGDLLAGRGRRGTAHRSTSPSTMSIDPITATTSAISSSRTMCGSALRLLKEGARTLQRYGRLPPSLTM